MTLSKLLAKLPPRARYFLHNVVGHPLMALFVLFGADRLAEAIHKATLPEKKKSSVAELNRKGIRGRRPQGWQLEQDAREILKATKQ